ncbi:ABC transporter ATP-binding protein [Marinobacterium weihaiense]|uniref:ATP-binding cassette domain-containing protein n=1 Tax=Marinobacterium weihaiense TaxID=2851016 RepID=A0ABS6M8Z1_9GAMM|nr:ATP-binding cassette domain-containing protein [Marinobacterium weihaiense]MBV0932761.1 ATP-binding cassette domain-containing protein [Marinobacterium weihaiense]
MTPILHAESLSFAWPGQPPLFQLPELILPAGEHLVITGPSGSGKTTLLNVLAGLQAGHSGHLSVAGEALSTLSSRALDRLRADRMGLLFQQFNLLPYLNLIDNVTLPCTLSSVRRDAVSRQGLAPAEAAERLLTRMQLDPALFYRRRVAELSIGQQQRVAAARALIGNPALILADEPTSALDPDNRDRFMALLRDELAACGSSLVMVSHDPALIRGFDHHLDLGALISC